MKHPSLGAGERLLELASQLAQPRLEDGALGLRVRGQAVEPAAQILLRLSQAALEVGDRLLTLALQALGDLRQPAFEPLGWDWRIGMAALASFPAREVVVGTLGIVYGQGKVEADEVREAAWEEVGETGLGKALRGAAWPDGRPVFTVPAALSLMVFFALCCQCASTLAVIRRETGSWGWAAFTFTYMTALAYLGALLTYQVGALFL